MNFVPALKGFFNRRQVFLALCVFFNVIALPVFAAPVQQISSGNVAYFLFSAPHKIERFDLATAEALSPVVLEKEPSAFYIDGSIAYVAFHRELQAINMDTGEVSFIRNLSSSVNGIVVVNSSLYVFTDSGAQDVTVLQLPDYTLVEQAGLRNSGRKYTASDSAIFYRDKGISPSDIHKVPLLEGGALGNPTESPYHGDYPSATDLWLSPNSNRIFDNAGIVYFTENLTYAGSLGGAFDALTFSNGNPVIARGTTLNLFTSHLLEAGSSELTITPQFLASFENVVYGFSFDDSAYQVESLDVSSFALPSPGEPLDGDAINYDPDYILSDGNNIVYSVDASLLTVFRWSTIEGKHEVSWSLNNPPKWATYSQGHQRLYLGYDSGKITYFDTTSAEATEVHFTTLPLSVLGLASVENLLFAVDSSGAWNSYYTFDESGTMLSSVEWQNPSREYLWSEAVGRLFHYRDGTSPNDLEWIAIDSSTGEFGLDGDSPFHGDTISTASPLRLDPTGELILNGGGQIVSANSLDVVNSLSNSIVDAVWVDGSLFTISTQGHYLQAWASNYELLRETRLGGLSLTAIREHGGNLLVVGYEQSKLVYRLIALDSDQDEDGIMDLLDNCMQVSNVDQKDLDGDGAGDSCDLDADNDGIPSELELSVGLNPLDASDAIGDLDGDGVSNRAEALAGSDLNNIMDAPEALSSYTQDFNDGWPVGFWGATSGAHTVSGGVDQSLGLFILDSVEPSVSFSLVTQKGILGAEVYSEAPWHRDETLHVYVDGVDTVQISADSDGWVRFQTPLEPGEHTISFSVTKDSFSAVGFGVIIDNLFFGADQDGDTIVNELDNCPSQSNRWQDDRDNDGIGDACDPVPDVFTVLVDADGDSFYDHFDNCPEIANVDQSDVDSDGLGDVCDNIDDRPADTDGDGVYDIEDNCPAIMNSDQSDVDHDWIGDVCDSTDNRPKDTDGDGRSDEFDNCLSIANSSQEDMDRDTIGDACDWDIDGDGLANVLEQQYDFLDEYNAIDAYGDQDSDGATNIYEIRRGADPTLVNSYEDIDLTEYGVMREGRYVYSKDNSRLVVDVLHMPETNTYLRTIGTLTQELKYGEYGLEVVASGDIFLAPHTNDVQLPFVMKEGHSAEFISSLPSLSFSGFTVAEGRERTAVIYFVAQGAFNLEGNVYPSVTVTTMIDGDPTRARTEVYAEGLGLVKFDGRTLTRFVPLLPTVDFTPVPKTGESTRSKSGGSISFSCLLLMLLTGFVFRRKRGVY